MARATAPLAYNTIAYGRNNNLMIARLTETATTLFDRVTAPKSSHSDRVTTPQLSHDRGKPRFLIYLEIGVEGSA